MYIFAPSRYIINIVAGENIRIDPAHNPIPVYCTADQARKAAETAHRNGEAPASMELRVYLLDGDWEELVGKRGNKYYLAKPASLVDTVD